MSYGDCEYTARTIPKTNIHKSLFKKQRICTEIQIMAEESAGSTDSCNDAETEV